MITNTLLDMDMKWISTKLASLAVCIMSRLASQTLSGKGVWIAILCHDKVQTTFSAVNSLIHSVTPLRLCNFNVHLLNSSAEQRG